MHIFFILADGLYDILQKQPCLAILLLPPSKVMLLPIYLLFGRLQKEPKLVVDGPRMFACWALVKDSLALIDTSQLNRVESDLRRTASHARLLYSCSAGFLRRAQGRLLLVGLGPKRNCPVGRVRGSRRNTGQRR